MLTHCTHCGKHVNNAYMCFTQCSGPVTNKPNPSKGQSTASDVATTTPLSRGTKLDGKNERGLLGDRNSNTFGQSPTGCSLGAAELVIIVGITFATTAALSTLLTITIGYCCLKRRQQRKTSENKQSSAPNLGNKNRSRWQEESSLDSMDISNANAAACGSTGAVPNSNSEEEVKTH